MRAAPRKIRSLPANVTQAQAISAFESRPTVLANRLRGGGLRRVAAVYVPFRLYDVEVRDHRSRTHCVFALDAVQGSLDLYRLDCVPADSMLAAIETRNCPPQRLDEASSLRLVHSKIERAVLQAGFFRVRDLQIRPELLPQCVHVPYWLGFIGRNDRASIIVMDAVRRSFEGAKARELFEEWLAHSRADS